MGFSPSESMTDYFVLIVPALISALIGAIVATIANYIYYRKTTHKENTKQFLKEQITELLLPLFIYFEDIESVYMDTFTDKTFPDNLRGDNEEDFMNKLLDNTIYKIVSEKLYLASPKLSRLLLTFVNYQYAYNYDEMDKIEYPNYILEQYIELKKTVAEEYHEKITLYQEIY